MINSADTTAALRSRALSLLVLTTAFWGLSFPLIKALMLLHEQLSPTAGSWFVTVYVLAPRFALAAALLAVWQWRGLIKTGIRRSEWHQGVGLGVFSSAGMLFQCDGMHYTAASTSAFLTQFYAILIPIFVALRSKRNPGLVVWTCSGLVLAGVAILGRFDWTEMHLGRGEVETIIASCFFMGQILWLERPVFSANRPGRISLTMFITQAAIYSLLLVLLAPSGEIVTALLAPWTSGLWVGFTLVLTVVCTVGAYGLMNAWQPKITATEAGLVYCAEPIFGSVFALFLPAILSAWALIDYANETSTWPLLVGGGLITVANVLIQVKPVKKLS
ncbi:hypothetical protein IMCC26134_02475 [Verrucomicrobia bacterium IMCC26134]|nr:hypothetical protein IMCC26134_02475 [Verrucomicrobia bacterium IMCC26134]